MPNRLPIPWIRLLAPMLLVLATLGLPLAAAVRIHPVGDSITAGDPSQGAARASYRYHLFERLRSDGLSDRVDLVGSLRGTGSSGNDGSGIDDQDMDHDGHWGATADEILDGGLPYGHVGSVRDWAPRFRPAIVLLHLGTNDLRGGRPVSAILSDLEGIIAVYRREEPQVTVLVAQIIKGDTSSHNERVAALNAAIPAWAAGVASDASPVLVVDCNTGFEPASHLQDRFHPNVAGAELMADRFYAVLRDVLTGGDTTAPMRPSGLTATLVE